MQIIHLNQNNFRLFPRVYMVQNDTGRDLKMVLDDTTLAGTETGVVAIHRSDGSYYTISATLVIADNAFTADMTQALTQPGLTECQLKVTAADDTVVSSYTFVIFVQPSTDGISEEQLGYSVQDVMDTAEQIMNLLSSGALGQPEVITQSSEMDDQSTIYLYLGNQTGYTNGHVYAYINGAWTDTGLYGQGQAGVSPVATVTQTANGATLSVTDANGTTTANIENGTATDAQVSAWLAAHPEATTTVQDGSITEEKLASTLYEIDESEIGHLKEIILYQNGTADSDVIDISNYSDVRLYNHYWLYDSSMTQIKTGWGGWVKSTASSTEAESTKYVKVGSGSGSYIKVYEKEYLTSGKLLSNGKYDSTGYESVLVTDTITSSNAHTYSDEEIDFSKSVKMMKDGGNQDIQVQNSAGEKLNSYTPTLSDNVEVTLTLPDFVKYIKILPFTGTVYITYYKIQPIPLTVPDLNLIRQNFTADTLEYLADVLDIGDSASMEDLRTDRNLVWSEDFNGSALNKNNWQHSLGLTGVGNRAYLRTDAEHHEINAFTANGELNLRILRDHPVSATDWSGVILRSVEKFQFQYGLLEAKIKFPTTGGYMTFWTEGQNGAIKNSEWDSETQGNYVGIGRPNNGELDIAESNGGQVMCGVHYVDANGNHMNPGGINNYSPNATTDYHIYSAEWTSEHIKIYLDNQLIKTFNVDDFTANGFNPFRNPQHIVLSHLQGVTNVIGTSPPAGVNELTGHIKWVRVYTPVGVDNVDPESIVIDSNIDASYISKSVGDEWLPTLTVTPSTVVNRTAMWSTSNPDVLVVCPDGGYVKCLSAGYATITCTMYNGVQASIIVHVT